MRRLALSCRCGVKRSYIFQLQITDFLERICGTNKIAHVVTFDTSSAKRFTHTLPFSPFFYLYITRKVCVAVFVAVVAELTLTVATTHFCCGRFCTEAVVALVVLVMAAG